MIIPEVMDRREDNDFEDWLTASVIENTNQQGENDDRSSSPGLTDLWMLETSQRNGKIWSGNLGVEFSTEQGAGSHSARAPEDATGVLSFFLDTYTGEMRFNSQPRKQSSISRN